MHPNHRCEYRQRVVELEREIAFLQAELARCKGPAQTSANSSIPPSQDQTRPLYPKRQKSDKKSGGQTGHRGRFHPL